MRRHVENQAGNAERDGLGILVLFAMWVLALMALSAAARGEEKQEQQSTTAVAAQDKLSETQKAAASTKDDARDSAQHHLHSKPQPAERANARDTGEDTGEQVTLTRFILVSIPDRQLALVDNGQVVKVYPIAVGATHTPSPQGEFTINRRVANPMWSHKGKVVAPGKGNPVGSRWIGLNLKGYGIHGTNAPRSIGKAASHGCFRMGKKDIEELFTLVRVGDTVAVRAERDELVAQVFGGDNKGAVQTAAATTATVDADEE
ncbi:MAG TPA: L,D-transpeptidase [Candidatus Angelobacter sp.]|nr:L,D-transpeptidase [Candidatus Angelobacter sp.]